MIESCKTCVHCIETEPNNYECSAHKINVSVKVWSISRPIGCTVWALVETIIVTKEFKKRLKQRLGLPYKAALRHAKRILDEGVLHGDYYLFNNAAYAMSKDGDTVTFITVLTDKSKDERVKYHGGEYARGVDTSHGKFACVQFKKGTRDVDI